MEAATSEDAEMQFVQLVAQVPIARFFELTNVNVRPAEQPEPVAGSAFQKTLLTRLAGQRMEMRLLEKSRFEPRCN